MKAYSVDLRRKIVEAVETGTPKAQVARTFGIGLSTVKRYAGRAERGEGLAPRKSQPPRRLDNVGLLIEGLRTPLACRSLSLCCRSYG